MEFKTKEQQEIFNKEKLNLSQAKINAVESIEKFKAGAFKAKEANDKIDHFNNLKRNFEKKWHVIVDSPYIERMIAPKQNKEKVLLSVTQDKEKNDKVNKQSNKKIKNLFPNLAHKAYETNLEDQLIENIEKEKNLTANLEKKSDTYFVEEISVETEENNVIESVKKELEIEPINQEIIAPVAQTGGQDSSDYQNPNLNKNSTQTNNNIEFIAEEVLVPELNQTPTNKSSETCLEHDYHKAIIEREHMEEALKLACACVAKNHTEKNADGWFKEFIAQTYIK